MKLRASVVCVAVVAGVIDPRIALAQEATAFVSPLLIASASVTEDEARPFAIQLQPIRRDVNVAAPPQSRPAPLVGLYVSLAALHALDLASTQKAIAAGAAEANPMMAPFARSPFALAAVKAGLTAATIVATERLWKRNRKAAVLTMIGINATYGAIAAHNYRVAAAQRGR